jgi:hypothetical protein
VTRNPVILAQTILRRILFTGGSGVLSTTGPAGGVFAAGGKGGFTVAGEGGVVPAATVSPGDAVVFADSS